MRVVFDTASMAGSMHGPPAITARDHFVGRSASMNEAHEIKFRILAAMTAIEREIGHQLGLALPGHFEARW